jgi:16S rRNA (adenine1518-N6/adenine1519-N6)-dimethyltransferase
MLVPLVRALFASRRKTIKNNLEHFAAGRGIKKTAEISAAVFEGAKIKPEERAENLGLEEFIRLAESFEKETR